MNDEALTVLKEIKYELQIIRKVMAKREKPFAEIWHAHESMEIEAKKTEEHRKFLQNYKSK